MNISKRKLLAISLMMPFYKAYACAMGFSFNFVGIDEKSSLDAKATKKLDAYLDDLYGKSKWEYMSDDAIINMPKIAKNSNVISVTIGSDSIESAGIYKALELYVEEYIWVIDSKKYTDEYLPKTYHVDDLSKNSNKAFNFKEITYKKSRIIKIASFILAENTLPYITTRLKLPGSNEIKVAAVLIPKDDKDKIKVLKQSDTTRTGHPCSTTYFIDGEWPNGLRKEHRYE